MAPYGTNVVMDPKETMKEKTIKYNYDNDGSCPLRGLKCFRMLAKNEKNREDF